MSLVRDRTYSGSKVEVESLKFSKKGIEAGLIYSIDKRVLEGFFYSNYKELEKLIKKELLKLREGSKIQKYWDIVYQQLLNYVQELPQAKNNSHK